MAFVVNRTVVTPKRFSTQMYVHDVFRSIPAYKYLSKCDTIRYLTSSKKNMYEFLERKISIAMKNENGNEYTHEWDTIEEISSCIYDIETKLEVIKDQRECWDDIECLIYD